MALKTHWKHTKNTKQKTKTKLFRIRLSSYLLFLPDSVHFLSVNVVFYLQKQTKQNKKLQMNYNVFFPFIFMSYVKKKNI